ncbi:MAG TPA: Ig-like domain-containing protein [Gemmatimonadaceae bacterium]
MRRLIAVCALGLACASPGMPPGGPPDVAAPQIVRIVPDSGKTGVTPKEVVFQFDEVVSERPPAATTLSDLFLISPRDGQPNVHWHRDAISVRPRRGWRPNTAYTITMLRGIADIRGNVRNEGVTTFFSTGANIPRTRITGYVFDWVAGTLAAGAVVEAMVPPDTVNSYIAITDSSGVFALERIPAGRYTLRAFLDRNRNQALDPGEPWDSAGVTLVDSLKRELLVFMHDTVPPRIRDVSLSDSVTISVAFDRPVDPAQTLGVTNFRVLAPDSSAIAIVRVAPPARDTGTRVPARDTTAQRPTTGRAPSQAAGRARAVARPDSTPKPVMSRPIPTSTVNLTLQRPLAPRTTYRVHALGIRGLLGVSGDSERSLITPAPPVKPPPASTVKPPPASAPPLTPASPPPRDR